MSMLDFDINRLKVVPIDSVRPNSWNPKKKGTKEYHDLVTSIKVNGLEDFVYVRENNGYEIVDGEQTWTAAKELGLTAITIYNGGKMSDEEAMAKTLWRGIHTTFSRTELRELIQDKLAEFSDLKNTFLTNPTPVSRPQAPAGGQTIEIPKPTGEMLKGFSIQCTTEQYDTIGEAISRAKKANGSELTEAEALDFICKSYLKQL